MSDKTNTGRFFEDYKLGEVLKHAIPRTLSGGERALYHALYPARHALSSSDVFAQSCGLPISPFDPWIVFHTVFGKTVPDVSLNAVANLGYSEGRFHKPVWPGDTLRAVSEVIGLKQNSNGRTGVVWVRTRGINQRDETVLEYVRWVMLRKRDYAAPAPDTALPELTAPVPASALLLPDGLHFSSFDHDLSGSPHRLGDYAIGEIIDHVDGVTLEDAEHKLATKLWQNTAKVHFDHTQREDGRALIYGGHIISLAHALSFNGLANAVWVLAINSGSHVGPAFAGDTVWAWSEVLDKAELSESVGAIRLRLVAAKRPQAPLRGADGKYDPDILLDFDYWAAMPI